MFRKECWIVLILSLFVFLISGFMFMPKTCIAEQITIRVSRPIGLKTQSDWDKQFFADYEREHPNIKINYEMLPPTEQMAKLQTEYAAGGGPDIFWISETIGSVADTGLPLPAPSEVAQDIRSNYTDFAVECCTWKGEIYSFPDEGGCRLVWYNEDMFEEAGIMGDPQDWEEFRNVAKKLTIYDESGKIKRPGLAKEYAKGEWGGTNCFAAFFYMNGGEWMSEDLTEVTFDSPEGIEALEYYTGLVTKDKVAYPYFVEDAFPLKQAAMLISGPWNISHFEEVAPDLNAGVFLIPPPERGGEYAVEDMPWHVMVNANSKHPQEAWQLLSAYFSDEVQIDKVLGGAAQQVWKKAVIEAVLPKLPPLLGEFVEASAKYAHPRPKKHWVDICYSLGPLIEMTEMGQISPAEAMKEAADRVRTLIEEKF